jgi:hypothetical protein
MHQNSTQEEFKSRLKSGNAAIIWCRNLCLPVCYPKIRLLTLRTECRLKVFENRMLRRIFGPKWD